MSAAKKLISASGASGPTSGEAVFTSTGSNTWTCPDGVTSVCVVCIGGGKGYPVYSTSSSGGGGGLGYKNNITVVPGNNYTVMVGRAEDSNDSYFINTSTVKGGTATTYQGGTYTGDGGGNGGDGQYGGGGGAGGYSGNGGASGSFYSNSGSNGSGGGGGGGGNGDFVDIFSGSYHAAIGAGGGGGGTGLYGEGSSGAGGAGGTYGSSSQNGGSGGGGGSNGSAGGNGATNGGAGGAYGGGGGMGKDKIGTYYSSATNGTGAAGSPGAVRIIWGDGRSFPSTNVAEADSDVVYLNNVEQ